MFFVCLTILQQMLPRRFAHFSIGIAAVAMFVVRPRIMNGHLLVNKTHLIQPSAGQI